MRKWVVGLVAAMAVISVGGVGFAAFTSSVVMQLNGVAGSLSLQWTGPSSPATTVGEAIPTDSAICAATLTSSSLIVTFKNAAPNDSCTILPADGVFLYNSGTLTGVLGFTNQYKNIGAVCNWHAFWNTPDTIGPGASVPSGGLYAEWVILGGPNNACQGSILTWWLNQTATAGT